MSRMLKPHASWPIWGWITARAGILDVRYWSDLELEWEGKPTQECGGPHECQARHLQDPFLNTPRLEYVPVRHNQATGKRGACAVNACRAGENGGHSFV